MEVEFRFGWSRYRFDSVWVDADVEYVGSVGDRVVVLWHSYNDLPDTLVEYSDSVRISYSLIDTSRDVLRFRGYKVCRWRYGSWVLCMEFYCEGG